MTCQNDAKRFEQECRARMARDVLSQVPPGLVVIVGPAVASTWEIVNDTRWDEKAKLYLGILKECGHPVITSSL